MKLALRVATVASTGRMRRDTQGGCVIMRSITRQNSVMSYVLELKIYRRNSNIYARSPSSCKAVATFVFSQEILMELTIKDYIKQELVPNINFEIHKCQIAQN